MMEDLCLPIAYRKRALYTGIVIIANILVFNITNFRETASFRFTIESL